MNTVAIIQVRLGSMRLPEKALKRIGPMVSFAHVYYRVKEAVSNTVVACPTQDYNTLRNFLPDGAVTTVPCDEEDRLARTYLTARLLHADTIVRVTGDCVFTSPEEIQRVLYRFDGNYVENEPSALPYHGMECQVFSMGVLTDAYEIATSQFDRDHTVPYMRRRYGYGESEGPDSTIFRARRRGVLDTQEDLDWFRAVADVLNVQPPKPDVATLLAAIDAGIIPQAPENEVTHNA